MFWKKSRVCTPKGLECYQNISTDEYDCNIPCQGLYADITHIKDTDYMDNNNYFQTIKNEYELFKRGNVVDVEYPNELAGNFSSSVHSLSISFQIYNKF